MPEALDIANLILGIIGTVTGSIAVVIHFWGLKKANPHLDIKPLKSEHSFKVSTSQVKTVSFWTEFEVKNLGDRGTSINDISLSFKDNNRKITARKKWFRLDGEYPPNDKIWIDAHKTLNVGADFVAIEFQGDDKDQIDCVYMFHHTHRTQKIETTSKRRAET